MLKLIVKACLLILGGTLGIAILPLFFDVVQFSNNTFINNPYSRAILGAFIFYFITIKAVDHIVNFIKIVENSLVKAAIMDTLFGSLGLMVGLLLAFLIGYAINTIKVPIIHTISPILLALILGYLGLKIGLKKHGELLSLFKVNRKKVENSENNNAILEKHLKILDTNVIIDGRIADICKSGFIEGVIVIPQFVLLELQHIADSSDTVKRNRGRRGLDILNQIQKEINLQVEIYEDDFEEIQEVEIKLVKLAKLTNGVLVTNDDKLNKICELKKVPVLNINDLSNAVSSVIIPGEEMEIEVIKVGKDPNQGVGYLEDGTMIVIEDGRPHIGKRIGIMITSVLQKSSGRMIFAKYKN